tara:strand:- start:2216 stop:2509 length:294 start_codon:yes stop_codon:yes gene_type:complete
MAFVKGVSGNPKGRPKNSINNLNAVKRQLQSLLGNVLIKELTPETINTILAKASPSARLRFIEGCLKYLIPTITIDNEIDQILNELELLNNDQKREN